MEEKDSAREQERLLSEPRITNLEKEIAKSASKIHIAQNLIDELKSQNKKLVSEGKTDYAERLKDLNMKLQSEKVQNSVHRDVIASMSPQIEKLKCDNESLEASVNSLKEKQGVSEAELTKKRNEVDSLKSRLSLIEKKLGVKEVSASSLAYVTQKLETKAAESDNLAVDLIEITDRCSDFEKQFVATKAALQLCETQKADLENYCDELKQQVLSLKEDASVSVNILELQSKLDTTQANMSILQSNYETEMEKSKKVQSLEDENKQLQNQRVLGQQSIAELQALVIVAAKELQEVESQKEILMNTLGKAQAKVKALVSQNDTYQRQLEQTHESLLQHESQTTSMKSQIANLDSELIRASRSNDTMIGSLKSQIYSLTQDKSALQSRNDKLVIEVDKILSEKQIYIDEIESLASELKQAKISNANSCAELQNVVDSLHEKLASAYERLEEHPHFNEDIESEAQRSAQYEDLSVKNLALQSQVQSLKLELSQTDGDKALAKEKGEQLTSIEMENERLCSELEGQNSTLASMSKLNEDHQAVKQRLEKQLLSVTEENSLLSMQIQASDAELKEMKQSIEEERNRSIFLANKQAEKHKSEVGSLQDVISDISIERDELKRQTSMLRASSDDTTLISEYVSEIANLRKENEALNFNLETLQNEHLDQLSSSSAESCILQAQIDNMKEMLDKFEREKTLNENLKSLSSELQRRLRSEIKAHSETNVQFQVIKLEQTTFKEQVEDLKEKYEHCQQRCEELEAEMKPLELELKEKRAQTETLLSQLATVEKECQELECIAATNAESQVELDNVKVQFVEKEAECFNILSQNECLDKQLCDEKLRVKEISSELLAVQLELSSLKSGSMSQEKLETMKSQLDDQKAVCGLAKAAVALQFQSDSSDTASQKTTDDQDDYIDALQSEIKMLSGQLASTKKENDDLSVHVSDLDEQLSTASAMTNQVDQWREKCTAAHEECNSLRKVLATAKSNNEQRANRLNELESQRSHMENELVSLTSVNARIEGEKDLLVAELKTLHETSDNVMASKDIISADHELKYQELNNRVASLEQNLQDATDAKTEMTQEITSLKVERARLVSQARMSPQIDESNTDGVEYRGLHKQIMELKQKLQMETKLKQDLEKAKEDFVETLCQERQMTEESMAEVQKLQMSISMLMSSHQTEMTSLQTALSKADAKMSDLEEEVLNHSQHSNGFNTVLAKISTELRDIKVCRDDALSMVNALISQNASECLGIKQRLCTLLQQVRMSEERVDDISTSSSSEPLQSTLIEVRTLPLSSSPLPNPASSMDLSFKSEPLSVVSHYGQLSKADLVAKLSDQTKHELILRKHLEEARQSLTFYRSAIDNIIDCLGTAMPGVKKWANDVLNVSRHISFVIMPLFRFQSGAPAVALPTGRGPVQFFIEIKM